LALQTFFLAFRVNVLMAQMHNSSLLDWFSDRRQADPSQAA